MKGSHKRKSGKASPRHAAQVPASHGGANNLRMSTIEILKGENQTLRRELDEARDALRAIRNGQVDAIVVNGNQGAQIFSLAGADHIYRVLVETMYEAALTVGPDGTILFCNQRFCDLMKIPLGETLGRKLANFAGPGRQEELAGLLAAARSTPVQRHFVLQAADRSAVPVQIAANLLESGKDSSICVVASDLTELEATARSVRILRKHQREMEETQAELRAAHAAALNLMEDAIAARRDAEQSARELRESERRLRDLTEQLERRVQERTAQLKSAQEQLRGHTRRLHAIQEEMRGRLASDLHDEFGAALTALKLDLHWIMNQLPEHTTGVQEKLRAMSRLINDTVDSVRQMATMLRPRLLDDFGLIAAVEWQTQEFQKRTGTRVLAELPEEIVLDRESSTALFRMLQEALTNVARHANATEIAVRLLADKSKVLLEIKDNGIGMEPEAIANGKSFGLFGMQERAHAFGGHVRINSGREQGTTVTVEIPPGGSEAEKKESRTI